MMITRKQFLRSVAGLGALGSMTLAGCGGGGDDAVEPGPAGTAATDCAKNGTSDVIGNNHGHTLTVSAADVIAGASKSYSIQGSSGHSHTVEITAAHFALLQANTTISLNSSIDELHSHSITVGCAA